MKKHYVTRWDYENKIYTNAACGLNVGTLKHWNEATYRKNHVTCGNCRRTKVFRGVK